MVILREQKGLEERVNFNFNFILSRLFPDNEIITKFLNDFDLGYLIKSLNRFSGSDEKLLRSLIDAFNKISAVNGVAKFMKANIDYDVFLDLKEKQFTDQLPSLQQSIALTEGIQFLNTDSNIDNFSNWLLVRGIGGAGKTFFMASSLLDLQSKLTNSSTNVYAFSKEKLTSENINNALKSDPKSSFEGFMNLTIDELKALDVIVIDEVYTFNNDEIRAINNKIAAAQLDAEPANTDIDLKSLSDFNNLSVVKNEGTTDRPTKESVTEKLNINSPFYKKSGRRAG